MTISRRTALAGMTGLPLAAAAAQKDGGAKVEHLGQPCVARNVHNGRVIRDRGREWFVITNTNEVSGVELIFIDAKTDEGQVYRAPAGAGAWALAVLPGNRLAAGTYYDGTYLVFDVPSRKWVKTVKFPGEDYLWSFALGGDGRLYGGTYPGGKLGAVDLKSYDFEDVGAPSKAKNNLYLRQTSALPDGRVYCQFGFTNPETLVFDPKTKAFTPAPAAMQGVAQGIAWDGYFLAGNKVYRMPDLAEVPPHFPTPPAGGGEWSVDLRLTGGDDLVLRQGNAIYRYRADQAALTKLVDFRLGAVTLFAMNEAGEIFGVRGQDYFVLRPGDRQLALKRIPGESAPRGTHFLYVDAQERVWGGPTFGQTLFTHDPETRKTVNTRTISDSGGEVYDVEVIDGVCYAVAYAGGEVIRFDPGAPWDQINHVNPKTIARVGPDYIRPAAGVVLGSDGRLYAGWWAKYGSYGGALSITDPKSGDTEVIRDPLGPQGLTGLAIAGNVALLGTTTRGNGLPAKPDSVARFGIYDLKARKVVYERAFEGSGSVSGIRWDVKSGRAALLVDGMLHLFDLAKREFVGGQPGLREKVTSHGIETQAGRVVYGIEDTLFALDLATLRPRPIAKLPEKVESIAVAPRGRLYVSCGVDLYRVTA